MLRFIFGPVWHAVFSRLRARIKEAEKAFKGDVKALKQKFVEDKANALQTRVNDLIK